MLKWLYFHAAQAGWSPAELARSVAGKNRSLPRIDFVAEAERCGVCGCLLRIHKSAHREVVTYSEGPFEAWEVSKACSADASHPVARSCLLYTSDAADE